MNFTTKRSSEPTETTDKRERKLGSLGECPRIVA